MIRWLVVVALASCGQPTATAPHPPVNKPPAGDVTLPVTLDHDRWFLATTTKSGAPLRIYLDSAGGVFLTKTTVERLKLATTPDPDDPKSVTVELPELADPHIPRPLGPMGVLDEAFDADGMFGAPWFATRTVTFDYPHETLTVRAPGALPTVAAEHRITVGFPREAGIVTSPYGRVQMTVDGKQIDMLFDTGATVDLVDPAIAVLGPGPSERATCFITNTVFDAWHAAHPDWRIIPKADRTTNAGPMIEVPAVEFAGYTVGPVWFAWRPDRAFHEWMASIMDKPSEGALGGNAFATLRITVDWAAGVAAVER